MGFHYILNVPRNVQYIGPLKKLFHYAIFQKFFHILLYINGLCFTIHVI